MGTGWHASTWHAAPHARREGIAEWLHLRARASRSLIVLLLAWCALGSVAQAHQTKLSSSRLVVEGTRITARIEMNGGDLESGASTTLTGASTEVLPERLVSERAAIHRYLRAHVRLASSGGFACEWSRLGLAPKGEHVVADAQWRCPAVERALVYRVTLFHEVDPGARHMVTVDGPKKLVALLDGSHPELTLSAAGPSLPATLLRYLFAGVEHILIGYDHIAFLLAVIVVDRRFWSLFKAVSAFTVAHSITLALAALEIVIVPSQLVETTIAASIVYVAVGNLWWHDIRHRWGLTFAFGLIHGFGFASVLREYGLPRDAVGLALAAFNVGVEIGQLVIVVAAIALWRIGLAVARSRDASANARIERRASRVVSMVVLVAGLYWLGVRLVGTCGGD